MFEFTDSGVERFDIKSLCFLEKLANENRDFLNFERHRSRFE